MKVDANNLRRQACFAYDRLAKKLNESMRDGWRGEHIVGVDADEIQSDMDDLRQMVYALAYCYIEDDPDFANLADEVGDPVLFNPEPDSVTGIA